MGVDAHKQPNALRPGRRRRWRRGLLAAAPFVVWLAALAGAWHVHTRLGHNGMVVGFADFQPVTLAHPEPAIVRSVHVELYEEVVRGQLLLALDDRAERIELAAMEKDIERLRADLVAEQARVAADNARATADDENRARRLAVDRANAHLDYLSQLSVGAEDRARLSGATVEFEITRELYEQGRATLRELNETRTEVAALQAKLKRNADVVDRARLAFEEADRRWYCFTHERAVVVAEDPLLAPLRLAIEVRQRDLEDTVRRIDARLVRAPIAGQVTTLPAHEGDEVGAGEPLVMVSPTSTDRVVAYLPEHLVHTLGPGTDVLVNCRASANGAHREFPATVVRVAATVEEAPLRYRSVPTYPVWGRGLVAVLKGDVHLLPGEAVTLSALPAR
ncbi:MAG TPA: HlyD family efflux transporter periplasmic adaptor subunit [Phycisphaerae bacterium]|nr:HlyD family efflux transporter periplasmic adaptor subunit [Phycisphaerae bacterium]HNU44600.1 HlyD family efflux transporter periplasmic adaptor subunit [Phycisphaerae bacterium]